MLGVVVVMVVPLMEAVVLQRAARFLGPKRPVRVWNDGSAPVFAGGGLRVVVWNVQYGAGIRQHFFYDGGRAVSTPMEEVERTTASIAEALAATKPDAVLLQEVDRRSRRTGKLDEFEMIGDVLKEVGLGCKASAAYWRVPYVPSPKWEHVGRVGMHLATYSRYRIDSATRWQLPLLRESKLRQLFNLRRAVLDVALEAPTLDDDDDESAGKKRKPFHLVNTHLSAFSGGDGTLGRQVDRLQRKVLADKSSWLLAGDFNSLPPWESAADLAPEEAALYPEQGATPVAPLYADYTAAFQTLRDRGVDPMPLTYKPFTEPAPDRTIDHAFASPDVSFDDVQVIQPTDGIYLSDHQPIQLDLTVNS